MAQTSLFNRCRDSGSLAGREGKERGRQKVLLFHLTLHFLAFFFFFNTEILLICILCAGAVDTEAKLF